ncbi:helix-turn-helix domain-containing protein [uncultured Cohaesibacter sp.]|uniref:helix-turn-helix domain-containing protein n=1 Tax=uncultured Cohaesibacter sp. TaxID=1002546 RepID=UPI00292FE413|nr:helix-turn-helix domain-containing protein [uncultured Cohaesibacter sp.]
MSIQDVGWVLDQDIQNPGAKLVLVCIANHIHSRMDYAFPSIDNLALEASMSRRSVQRHIKWLEDENYLTIERSFDRDCRQTSNRYRLNLDRCETQYEGAKLSPSLEQEENEMSGGGCQSDTEEGDTADTLGGDTGDTPLIGIITGINNTPLTPKGAGRGAALAEEDLGSDWDRFCQKWRLAPGDSFERAKRAWQKLDVFDQGKAVKFAERYQNTAKGNSRKTAARTYLGQHLWEGFETAGASGGVRKQVFVVQDSAGWDAWRKHRQRPIPITHHPDNGKPGWWFDSLFPPGQNDEHRNAS